MNIKNSKKGFTMLMAIITTSLLLVVSFMVVNVAFKQLLISNANKESQYAFYNADSGIECGTFWDVKNVNTTNPFNPSTPGNIYCNGQTINPTRTSYNSSGISTSTFTLDFSSTGRGYVDVEVVKNQRTDTTTVNARGYNATAGSARRYQRGVTSSFPSNPPIPVAATWQNTALVTVSGNSLTATAAGWGNSGASSVQYIGSGDGFVEFSTNENNLAKAGALSNGDPDKNYTSLKYALVLNNSGGVAVYENGTNMGLVSTYVTGDVFKIELKNGSISYYKNGIILCGTSVCSHSTTPTYPLIFDTSFNASNATIINAKIAS